MCNKKHPAINRINISTFMIGGVTINDKWPHTTSNQVFMPKELAASLYVYILNSLSEFVKCLNYRESIADLYFLLHKGVIRFE